MSVKKFRFVSPGVFINEIDSSQLPASPAGIGPVVVGRSPRGPGLRPIKLGSFSEFINMFGNPVPGGAGGDVWREGNNVGPTYGSYAAQAYLRNSSPLTYVRLLGAESPNKTATGNAGWKVNAPSSTSGQGAYGLFIFNSSSAGTVAATGSLVVNSALVANRSGSIADKIFLTASDGTTFTFIASHPSGATTGGRPASWPSHFKAYLTGGTLPAAAANDLLGNLTASFAASASAYFTVNSGSTAGNLPILSITQSTKGKPGNQFVLTASGQGSGVTSTFESPMGMSGGVSTGVITGSHAATFYVVSGATNPCSIALSGTMAGLSADVTGTSALITSTKAGTEYQFNALIRNYSGSSTFESAFNFNRDSALYIRKVFNTNPQLTNAQTTVNPVKYWLGETYDRALKDTVPNAASRNYYAVLLPLQEGSGPTSAGNFEMPLVSAETPWLISQDLSTNSGSYTPTGMQKLFKLVALDEPGAWTSRTLKISVEDVKASTNDATDYGTFSIVVRQLSDSDNVVRVVETFNDCNLNPNSLNYVGRKVGDRYTTWDNTIKAYKLIGQYDNASRYIRMQMNTDVDNGSTDTRYLPFGFLGIPKYKDVSIVETGSPATFANSAKTFMAATGSSFKPVTGITGMISGSYISHGFGANLSASIKFPAPALRVSASDGGLGNFTDAYFGYSVGQTATSLRFDTSNLDLLHALGGIGSSNQFNATSTGCQASTAFSLDDIRLSGTIGIWASGSRASSTAASQSATAGGGTWETILTNGYDRFTVPLHSGFDGLEIVEPEPFNNTDLTDSTEFGYYAKYSLKRSIDAIADPEVVEMNLATIPGVTDAGITSHLLSTCEDRADSLAIIDLKDGFQPTTENTQPFADRLGSVDTTISTLRGRGINSSYGCAYYPWVQIRDTIAGSLLWAPPSIAALGTFSSSQRKTQVWFAPAGFNRGGLTEGSAGVPVVNVVERLTRKQRDKLYAANINPLAKFPAEGIVVFGQKTLQVTASALDRINVRRLLIFVKKRISQIATQILFEPNVRKTWDRFTGQAQPFLQDVKTNFGLSDFKLILDESTTTPDLIDRNVMYAKIFLKPTRAIEYIALDFNITRTGASFDD